MAGNKIAATKYWLLAIKTILYYIIEVSITIETVKLRNAEKAPVDTSPQSQ